MNYKEKAKELVDRFRKPIKLETQTPIDPQEAAKQCTLICVDEIIKENASNWEDVSYWQNVKQEIKRL